MRGMEPRYDDLVLTAHTEWELLHNNLRSERQHICWIRDIAAFNHIERGYTFDKGMRLSPIGLWAAASVAHGDTCTQESVLELAYHCSFRSPYGYFSSVYLPMLLFCLCNKEGKISLMEFEQMILKHCAIIPDILPDEWSGSGCLLAKSECLDLMAKAVRLAAIVHDLKQKRMNITIFSEELRL